MIIFIKDLHAQPIEAFELSFEALSYSSQIFCFEGTCFKTKHLTSVVQKLKRPRLKSFYNVLLFSWWVHPVENHIKMGFMP